MFRGVEWGKTRGAIHTPLAWYVAPPYISCREKAGVKADTYRSASLYSCASGLSFHCGLQTYGKKKWRLCEQEEISARESRRSESVAPHMIGGYGGCGWWRAPRRPGPPSRPAAPASMAVALISTTAGRTAAGGKRGRPTATACVRGPRVRASTRAPGTMASRCPASIPGQGQSCQQF